MMLKKMSITLLFTIVFAAVALIGNTQVWAGESPCEAGRIYKDIDGKDSLRSDWDESDCSFLGYSLCNTWDATGGCTNWVPVTLVNVWVGERDNGSYGNWTVADFGPYVSGCIFRNYIGCLGGRCGGR